MELEQIWAEYRSGLKSFLHSRVSDPAEVDDLLQQILIKTSDNLESIRSDQSIKGWLYQVANRTIIDFYRARARERDVSAEDLWYSENDDHLQQALSQCIVPFISALPSDSATLLTRIDLEGQSQKAYAEEHEISYSTLKSRVQKARGELRKSFERCCSLTLDQFGNITDCDPRPGKKGSC